MRKTEITILFLRKAGGVVNAAAAKFRKLSLLAYVLLFGAIFGDMFRRMSLQVSSEPLFYIFVLTAFAGFVMLFVKNQEIPDIRKRFNLTFAEICFAVCLLIVSYGLPNYLGLIKYAIFITLVTVYLILYYSYLFKGRFE